MGFNVFESLNRLCGLLMKTMSMLYHFRTVKINKLFLLIKTVLLPCILHFRSPFYGFVMLPTEFVVSVSGAYLINLYSSSGWGKLRGKMLCCVIKHFT